MMMMMQRCTLGVSVLLYNHRRLHSDTIRSNPCLHWGTYQSNITTSSKCPKQILRKFISHQINSQRGRSAGNHQSISSTIQHPARQSSDPEDHYVHQCRLLHLLVAVRPHNYDSGFLQLVPSASRRGVHNYVACQHQQCRQRVHLFVDQHAVQTSVRSARVTTLLFQIVLSFRLFEVRGRHCLLGHMSLSVLTRPQRSSWNCSFVITHHVKSSISTSPRPATSVVPDCPALPPVNVQIQVVQMDLIFLHHCLQLICLRLTHRRRTHLMLTHQTQL